MHLNSSGRRRPVSSSVALTVALLSASGGVATAAELELPPISIGAGMRTSFTNVDDGTDEASDFTLDSARLYINGSVTDTIKFTFNTEYKGDADNSVQVMDAVARFEFSDQFNIWAGRFLPPSDRANLYGPYYANNWKVYIDGVQDMWPNVAVGRDNGVAYWGQFGKVKLSAGVFDVPQTFGPTGVGGNAFDADLLYAGRVLVDFWEVEGGYYLNGTYYGDKDLLALGVAAQTAGDYTAYSADFLLEKKLAAGAVGLEAEYYKEKFDSSNALFNYDYDGYYVLAHYVFPQQVGIGKFQILGKFGEAGIDGGADLKTTEFDLNYLIKQFNARVSLFYAESDPDTVGADSTKQIGLGLQIQM